MHYTMLSAPSVQTIYSADTGCDFSFVSFVLLTHNSDSFWVYLLHSVRTQGKQSQLLVDGYAGGS